VYKYALKNLAVEHGPEGIAARYTNRTQYQAPRNALASLGPCKTSLFPRPTPRLSILLQLANARHHKGVATAELLLSNRGWLPTGAASAHFSLSWPVNGARKNGGMSRPAPKKARKNTFDFWQGEQNTMPSSKAIKKYLKFFSGLFGGRA
jgi:hypothetical protein